MRKMMKWAMVATLIYSLSILTACCYNDENPVIDDRTIEGGKWAPQVRDELNELLTNSGSGSYAVFDFDQTSIVHDISNVLWVYQIEHLCYADAPAHNFLDGIPTPEEQMKGKDITYAEMGSILASEYKAMADRLNAGESIETVRESDEFLDFRARMVTLMGAMDEQWGSWVSPEMKELYRCLTAAGIDTYVCSASLELIVEELACDPVLGFGLPAERVYGLRFVSGERITAQFDPAYKQPNREGKIDCIQAYMAPAYGNAGPVLVAGDSNGDVPMLTAFPDMKHGLIIDVAEVQHPPSDDSLQKPRRKVTRACTSSNRRSSANKFVVKV